MRAQALSLVICKEQHKCGNMNWKTFLLLHFFVQVLKNLIKEIYGPPNQSLGPPEPWPMGIPREPHLDDPETNCMNIATQLLG